MRERNRAQPLDCNDLNENEIILVLLALLQEEEKKEEKGTGAEAESQSQLVAKEDNKGKVWVASFINPHPVDKC